MQALSTGPIHARPAPAPPEGWAAALAAVLADPVKPRLVFQPIVDLRRGVVAGYEALSRFDGPADCGPDRWFAMADELGLGVLLEARVVAAALIARRELPANCFLSVNVSPHLLTEPALADVLLAEDDLSGIVLELTEHVAVEDVQPLVGLLQRLRAAGALTSSSSIAPWSTTPTGTRPSWPSPSCWAATPAGWTPGCWSRASNDSRNWRPSSGWGSRWRRATCSPSRAPAGRSCARGSPPRCGRWLPVPRRSTRWHR
jgi:hypothetical protein